ncbi:MULTISPECIES: patatin-like phospholipase family protein [unclassified Methylobacterium]|jgi:NTE family protein|uniref:patatin-like phospholipase family protein n=1 Tax=unclassified Methylobacterium TaxID=2615210 RepID=UPI0008EB9F29|nr:MULTISPECIES: patatin-like phospholipase family protein [unclassified Methylobacterium]SFU94608.1 NTE family protein [Methylobacterium sp. UNCCL125]
MQPENCPKPGCEADPTSREHGTEPPTTTVAAATPDGQPSGLPIRLALSGGGIRAAAFHAGVLKRLAEEGLLERVTHVSTVSGGSLLVSALVSFNEHAWPGSAAYLERTYPALRNLLTTVDLFTVRAIGWRGLFRFNRRILTHRASVLADLLAERWGVTGRVRDLPEKPAWLINTTSLHSGKCWRFSAREMGDWVFGRHYAPDIRLADAAAASAAVPYVLGALWVDLPKEGWFQTDPATRKPLKRTQPDVDRIGLWDGGVYENLGLEAIYKPGIAPDPAAFVICSDASGPVPAYGSASPLAIFRGRLAGPRLFDIASDQIRALRSRMFMRDVDAKVVTGALFKMGVSIRDVDIKEGRSRDEREYDAFLNDAEVRAALGHPTDLKAMTPAAFERIARHGFEVADTVLTTHSAALFPRTLQWRP